jgi:hypothetical protein
MRRSAQVWVWLFALAAAVAAGGWLMTYNQFEAYRQEQDRHARIRAILSPPSTPPLLRGPWHSWLGTVHHTSPLCTTGNNIEYRNLRLGTGDKPRCLECSRLSGHR